MMILIVGIIYSAIASYVNNDDFNRWANKCRLDGGEIKQDYWGSSYDHYECYKDGKIINHVN
jgi:hypothetical protein